MKKNLYIICLLLSAHSAFGQAITISAAKIIMPGSVDSCAVPTPGALSTLPSLGTPATNATWDLSGVALQNTFVTYAYRAKTAGFSTATYSDSTTYSLTTSSATSYKAWRNIQQGPGAVTIQGEEILTRQAKSIGSITGVALDSIVYPTQVLNYNATPLRIIKFPSTIGSVWVDSTARNLSFTLSISAAGMNNVPGEQRERRISVDSVVGWGSMIVPIVGKTKTAPIKVLQVHHYDISVDSFFLNGSAAPSAVLSAIGVAQGQSKTVVRTYFYRANATRPLIELIHSAPSHSSSASTFYIHAVELQEALGVSEISPTEGNQVYPNPVAAGASIQLVMPGKTISKQRYTLFNAVGQIVAQGLPQRIEVSGLATIVIPERIAAGLYYLKVLQDEQPANVVPLIVK
jgi:hypothetical protein